VRSGSRQQGPPRRDPSYRIVAIPKSTRADRIAENAEIFDFELTRAEMAQLGDLGGALRD
jgi:diketogulonate reductase-like aldo/keto reductase